MDYTPKYPQLEWRTTKIDLYEVLYSENPIHCYAIIEQNSQFVPITRFKSVRELRDHLLFLCGAATYPSLEEAKAYCQGDYDRIVQCSNEHTKLIKQTIEQIIASLKGDKSYAEHIAETDINDGWFRQHKPTGTVCAPAISGKLNI